MRRSIVRIEVRGDGSTHRDRVETRQLIFLGQDEVCEFLERRAALSWGEGGPFWKGSLGGSYGGVDVLEGCFYD